MTTIDSSSPLYLHPSDGSHSIVVEKLSGADNYRAWRRSLEICLASKRKLGFVYGTTLKDSSNLTKQEAWDTCNSMVISWLLNNISESIKKSVMFWMMLSLFGNNSNYAFLSLMVQENIN
ncbi:unnamed protein product [Amaranthus hypochondriacus]